MDFSNLKKTASRTRNPKGQTISFGPWAGGLVTARPAEMLKTSELSDAANIIYEETNRIRTRPGSRLIFSGTYTDPDLSGLYEMGAISALGYHRIDGIWYYLICAKQSDGVDGFFTYEEGSASATLIGDLEGEGFILYYNQMAVIFDGGYIKYWDGGAAVKLLYDDGLGVSRGYLIYRRDEPGGSNTAIGVSNGGAAVRQNAASWPIGLTVPPTRIYATISKTTTWPSSLRWEDGVEWGGDVEWEPVAVGSPVYARVRKYATLEIIAEGKLVEDASYLPTSPTEFSAALEVTTEMEGGGTPYLATVEYTAPDAGGEVLVWATDYAKRYDDPQDDGSWDLVLNAGVTGGSVLSKYNYMISLKPGAPPKARFGISHRGRIFAMEGEAGDNPTYLWYSGAYDPFDWSTENGGGYIDNQRLIGAIASWYQSVWIFGTRRDPAMFKLVGDTPSAFAMEDTLQKVGAHWKSTVVTPDDVYFLHPGGMDSILSIQEYGDVRAASQADNIADKIRAGYSDESIAGYEPNYGLVLLKMPEDPDAYVFHTRLKTGRIYGDRMMTFHPVATWRHAWQE